MKSLMVLYTFCRNDDKNLFFLSFCLFQGSNYPSPFNFLLVGKEKAAALILISTRERRMYHNGFVQATTKQNLEGIVFHPSLAWAIFLAMHILRLSIFSIQLPFTSSATVHCSGVRLTIIKTPDRTLKWQHAVFQIKYQYILLGAIK